jgi:hypothetical protein
MQPRQNLPIVLQLSIGVCTPLVATSLAEWILPVEMSERLYANATPVSMQVLSAIDLSILMIGSQLTTRSAISSVAVILIWSVAFVCTLANPLAILDQFM